MAPERYEGSQFPEGSEALEEFFCQLTPNTGNYDEPLFSKALSAVLKDVQTMTGRKSIYVTHSQGGRVGWATDTDNMAAVIAVEPGFAPEVGSDTYKKFVAAKVPMLFLFGDYIENGPGDIQSTGFWKMVLQQCRDFARRTMLTAAMLRSSICPKRISTATATSCSRRRTTPRLPTSLPGGWRSISCKEKQYNMGCFHCDKQLEQPFYMHLRHKRV